MKIYLVRHGKTDANAMHSLVGQGNNITINNVGVKQAKTLKEKLQNIKFDICFTSPLTRAKQTANIIVGDRVQIKEDARIMERYLGELEGKDRELYDISKYNNYELNINENKVEPIKDLFSRCSEFIEYLKSNYPKDACILVVSHYGCVRVMHHILSNTPKDKVSEDMHIENCYCEYYEA